MPPATTAEKSPSPPSSACHARPRFATLLGSRMDSNGLTAVWVGSNPIWGQSVSPVAPCDGAAISTTRPAHSGATQRAHRRIAHLLHARRPERSERCPTERYYERLSRACHHHLLRPAHPLPGSRRGVAAHRR